MFHFITQALGFIDGHIGILSWAVIGFTTMVLYLRGETEGLFPFIRDTISEWDPVRQKMGPSTKRMTLLVSVAFLNWGFVKLTLAVCRWIEKGRDPTTIYLAVALGVMSLAGATYLVGMFIGRKFPGQGGPTPDPDPAPPIQTTEHVIVKSTTETATQTTQQ